VPLKTYDEAIGVLRASLDQAKVDGGAKIEGFRRLDKFVRVVEKELRPQADLEALVRHEFEISPSLDGRSVQDDRKLAAKPRQMTLF